MDVVNRLKMFVALFFVQVLVLNHVHLLGVAVPLLYIYYAITFRRNTPWWGVLCSSFLLGLCIDIFTNTPGLAAGALTIVAFLQPTLLEMLAPRDSADNLEASAKGLGWGRFAIFSGVLTFIYCLVFFSLELFSFFNWLLWVEHFIGSTLLTWLMIMAIESVRSK